MKLAIYSILKTYIVRMIATFLSCMFWMVEGKISAITFQHWFVGLKTALFSATLLLILTFFDIFKPSYRKIVKATITAIVVACVDYFVHPGHFGLAGTEAILTGATTASLVFVISVIILHIDAI
jgi:hypothetical protein